MLIFRLASSSLRFTHHLRIIQTQLIMNAGPLTRPAPAPRVHGSTVLACGGDVPLLQGCGCCLVTAVWTAPHSGGIGRTPGARGAGRSGSRREKPLPQAGEGGLALGRCITGQAWLESRQEMHETSSHSCRAQINKSTQSFSFTSAQVLMGAGSPGG